jgi:eukaryotic-like serine/threonine-protein kinase
MTQPNPGPMQGQTLGTFYLESLLGVGGMAEIYRARDLVLQREVAVKVLPRALAEDPNYITRFREEARVVAALTHPNIVPVYTFGEERGLLYLVMPIMRQSLRDLLDADGALPPSEAAQFTLQVAAGLEAAHALGLVHRDVKPENVLLDADGHALLTDFGIARELATLKRREPRTLAATGLPVGTPEYMAPEQLEGRPLDQRADIYSLGVVLYELLTGAAPFRAETPYSVAAKVLTEPIVPPSALQPRLWPEIEAVVMRALSRNPQDRYPDIPTFTAALRAAIFSQSAAVAAGLSGPLAGAASLAAAPQAAPALSPAPMALSSLAPSVQAPAAALASRLLVSRLSSRRGALAVAALALALLVAGVGVLAHPGFLFGKSSQDAVLAPTIAPTATVFTLPTSPATTETPITHATAVPSPTNAPTHASTATPAPLPTATTPPSPTATPVPLPPPTATPQPTATPCPPNSSSRADCPGKG